jgi:hypothetical protein
LFLSLFVFKFQFIHYKIKVGELERAINKIR